MAERPKTSGAVTPEGSGSRVDSGEAVARLPLRNPKAGGAPDAHGNHGGIKRHRTAHEPLCDDCRTFERAYRRDYFAIRNSIEAYRLRDNAAAAKRMARKRAADVEAWRRRQALYRKRRREADEHDRRRCIDAVVVRRLAAGEVVPHNRAERLEAVRQLRARGSSYDQISDLLHIHPRQVHRDLTNSTGAVA